MAKRVTQKTDAAAPEAAEETVPAVVPDAPPEAVSAEASLPEPEATPEPEEVPAPVVEELTPEDVAPEDPRPVDPPRAEPMLAAQPPLPEPQPGPGAGSLILGGVVAAVIGAGAALYAVPLLPPQLAGWVQAPQPDTAGINSVVSAQGARIDTLAATIESLKSAPPQAAAPSGLQAAIDESAANLRSLQEGLQALTDRVVALETRPVAQAAETETGPGPDLAALRADLEALRGRVDGLGNGQQIQEQIAAAAAQMKGEVEAAQGQAAQIGASVEAAAKRSLAQAAVARVGAAVQAGAPLAPALADAEAAGLSVPAALRADVPSLLSLQTSFPEAARPALKAARKAVAGSGIGERLGAFLIAQTGARSLTPHEGTDPDAVMSRAQAAVDAGDLARALQELGGLPEAGQAMMSGWITGAQKRIAAADAVAELAQSVK